MPLLNELALVEDERLVGSGDRGQTVRDHDHGAPARQAVEGCLQRDFVLRIGVRRGFVQDHDRGVLQERPRNGQPLALAAREPGAALAEPGLVPLGQRRDELMRLRGPRRLDDLAVRRIRLRDAQVRRH